MSARPPESGGTVEHDLRPLLRRLLQMRQSSSRERPSTPLATVSARKEVPAQGTAASTSRQALNPQLGVVHENQAYIGINDWWDYQEDTIPGVGKYMVNVGIQLNLLLQADDMAIPNRGIELVFRRTYNEQERAASSYGNGWTNTFNANLQLNTDPQGNYVMSVRDVDGARYDYVVSGSNCKVNPGPCKFTHPPGQHAILSWDGNDGFFWTKKSGTVYYFYAPYLFMQNPSQGALSGLLTSISGRNHNNQLTFSYSFDNGNASSAKYLNGITVTADATSAGTGRQAVMHFADFNGHRLLKQLVWPNGTSVGYAYDGNANLVEVDEPPLSSAYAKCLAQAPCRPQQYAYLTTDGQLGAVSTPRWVESAGADGLQLQITPNQYGLISALKYVGNVNPTIPDGTNAGPLQAGYPAGVTPYRSVTVTQVSGQTVWSDSDGHQTIYNWDSSGRVGAREDNTGTKLLTYTARFDSDNNPVASVDPRGNVLGGTPAAYETDSAYDANGNTIAVAKPPVVNLEGTFRPTSYYSYDAFNNITAYCDPEMSHRLGKDWTASPTISDSLCPAQAGSTIMSWLSATYEPYGELQTVTYPQGNHETYSYSPAGQSGTDFGLPTGVVTDAFAQVDGTTITPAQGFAYNFYGDLTAYSKGLGNWQLTYDTIGRNLSVVDPDGVQTSATTFYADSHVHTVSSASQLAAGVTTAHTYDEDTNDATQTHYYGCVPGVACAPEITQKWYDGDGRLVEVELPYAAATTGGYAIDYASAFTRYFYDLSKGGASLTVGGSGPFAAHGNLYKTQEFYYNANPLTQIGAFSAATWNDVGGSAYDALDRTAIKLSHSAGNPSMYPKSYIFDGTPATLGYLTTIQDPLSRTTSYAYDAAGRTTAVSFAGDGGVTPARNTVFDADDRVASITSSLYGKQSYAYDLDSRQTESIEASKGGVTAPATLFYDLYPNGWRKDLRIAAAPAPLSGPQTLLNYAYRTDGKLSSRTMIPYNQRFAWAYTNAGREVSRTDPYTGATLAGVAMVPDSRTYDKYGRESSHTWPNGGAQISFGYDDEGGQGAYGITLPRSYAPPGTVTYGSNFGYSVRGELTGTALLKTGTAPPGYAGGASTVIRSYPCAWIPNQSGGCFSFVDGPTGAVLGSRGPATPHCTPGINKSAYSYDAAGERVESTSTQTSAGDCNPTTLDDITHYDSENHSIGTSPGPTASIPFGPDSLGWGPNGHPVYGLVGNGVAPTPVPYSFHWDGDTLLFVTDATGKLTEFHSGHDEIINPTLDTSIVLARDQTGTALLSYDSAGLSDWNMGPSYYNIKGALVAQADYPQKGQFTTFGLIASDGRVDGYQIGEYTIQGVRNYDQATQQWTTPDAYQGEIEDPLSLKPYVWNRNNPVIYSDPSGFDPSNQEEEPIDPESAVGKELEARGAGSYLSGESASIREQVGVPKDAPAFDESKAGHMFRAEEGHVPDTALNRAIIQKTASDPKNLVHSTPTREGSTVKEYRKTLPNGSEAWAKTTDGRITNGGIRPKPLPPRPLPQNNKRTL